MGDTGFYQGTSNISALQDFRANLPTCTSASATAKLGTSRYLYLAIVP